MRSHLGTQSANPARRTQPLGVASAMEDRDRTLVTSMNGAPIDTIIKLVSVVLCVWMTDIDTEQPHQYPGPRYIDLVQCRDLTFSLLDATKAWRERAVHEIVLRDRDHVYATTAYQIRLPLELIRQFRCDAVSGDLVRLVLPFTVRPNELLLNVDITGSKGQPAALLPASDIAELQAHYISHLDGRPLDSQPAGGGLWKGVSAYTTFAWREHLSFARQPAWKRFRRRYRDSATERALAEYLKAGLRLNIGPGHVACWLDKTEAARAALTCRTTIDRILQTYRKDADPWSRTSMEGATTGSTVLA